MTDSAASTDDVWTVQKILQWTTQFFSEKGVESPRLEAELLLAHARKCQRINLYTDFDTLLTENERARMREFVKRRSDREPLSYITGRREFYGRDFSVGKGVLVPRPETETLIDICLEMIPNDKDCRIYEIGFGSGCICGTLARQKTNVQMVASDISEDAMRFASKNMKSLEVEDRVTLLSGDGFNPALESNQPSFDGIVSNPPYIRDDELPDLEPEVARHEPSRALVSGHDGLELIRTLIAEAPKYLKPGGWMALELDPAQSDEVADLYRKAGFCAVLIHNDLNGHDRVVSARLSESQSE